MFKHCLLILSSSTTEETQEAATSDNHFVGCILNSYEKTLHSDNIKLRNAATTAIKEIFISFIAVAFKKKENVYDSKDLFCVQ